MKKGRAVVLLSGGLDSATVLAVASSERSETTALSFWYGQRHSLELEKAKAIAEAGNVAEHLIIELDPEPFRGSALTENIPVPENRGDLSISSSIPSTYVPARNTIFLSIALGVAESRGAEHIYTGVNSIDYSGYPDCRPEYIQAFQKLAALATRGAVLGSPPKIEAPLLYMTKAEIIRLGTDMGVDYSRTLSCYQPDSEGRSCGVCDACRLRLEGFKVNGLTDPIPYKSFPTEGR